MRIYDPLVGETIASTARVIVALAQAHQEPITAEFNGVALVANPGDTADTITNYYRNETQRLHEEYINSPEYAERQRQAREDEERRQHVLRGALSVSPEKMTLRDEDAYQLAHANNKDPYGAGILRYAELWARLMEGRMSHGDTVDGCADEASHVADVEDITGFMYGAAVSFLTSCWVYGEELRRWHNLKVQLVDEGERANEGGGVLNPAILNIGTRSQ